ncbi:MAG: hypothetical protein LBL44_03425, partial [Treponema sp.]|nr:hypothetical protein [Treponema sp.]
PEFPGETPESGMPGRGGRPRAARTLSGSSSPLRGSAAPAPILPKIRRFWGRMPRSLSSINGWPSSMTRTVPWPDPPHADSQSPRIDAAGRG